VNDIDTAIREQQQCIALNPGFANAYTALALAQLAGGRRDEAVATWERLRGVSDAGASAAVEGLADLALYEGRLSDARALLEKGIEVDRASKNADALARKLVMLGGIQLERGDAAGAVASAHRAVEGSQVEYLHYMAGALLAEAGDETGALAIAGDLDRHVPAEPRMYAEVVRGMVELRRKDYPAAVNRFQSAVQRLDTWVARFALGRAYAEAGALVHAQEELERCENRRGEATDVFLDVVPTYRFYPPVLYYLGRAYQGGPASAGWYAKYLAIAKGDEDPMAVDARRRAATAAR
jgi:tetratricopeptide (TPR) repeat protein